MGSRGRAGIVGLLAGFLVSGCAGLRVGSDYDRDASFAGSATYDWVATPEDELEEVDEINPFLDRRLKRAVEVELEALGFRRVEEGPVDLLVSVSVLYPDGADGRRPGRLSPAFLVGFGLGFGYAPGFWSPWGYSPWYPPGYGWPWSRGFGRFGFGVGYSPYFGYPYGYRAYGPYGAYGGGPERDPRLAPGSFVVDVMDGDTGDLVWRGWAEGALAYAPDEDELPAFVSSVVHRIMERFPPERERS